MPGKESPWEFVPDDDAIDADSASVEEEAMHIEPVAGDPDDDGSDPDPLEPLEQDEEPTSGDHELEVDELLEQQGYLDVAEVADEAAPGGGLDSGVWRVVVEAERDRLVKLRQDVSAQLPDGVSQSDFDGELSSMDQHPADGASTTVELEVEHSLLKALDDELTEIEHAMGRLDRGTYGLCETCHAPVGDERLRALPAARHCISHELSAVGQVP